MFLTTPEVTTYVPKKYFYFDVLYILGTKTQH